jgi:hypothetical protein
MAETHLRIRNNPNETDYIIIDDINFSNPYPGPHEASGPVIWLSVDGGFEIGAESSAPSNVNTLATTGWPANDVLIYDGKICYASGSSEEICFERVSGKKNYIKIDFENETLGLYRAN